MINLIYTTDDIFKCEPLSIIAHACSCRPIWGAGIALEIKKLYPEHFEKYKMFCEENNKELLIGGMCVIDLTSNDYKSSNNHFIACLFTSKELGGARYNPETTTEILQRTSQSIKSLINYIFDTRKKGTVIKDIHMPKINSGLFGVPWNQTEKVIKQIDIESNVNVYIHLL